MFEDDIACPLQCVDKVDSQEHLMRCCRIISQLSTKLKEDLDNVKYKYIYGNIHEQLKITKVFQTLIRIRERLLETDLYYQFYFNSLVLTARA